MPDEDVTLEGTPVDDGQVLDGAAPEGTAAPDDGQAATESRLAALMAKKGLDFTKLEDQEKFAAMYEDTESYAGRLRAQTQQHQAAPPEQAPADGDPLGKYRERWEEDPLGALVEVIRDTQSESLKPVLENHQRQQLIQHQQDTELELSQGKWGPVFQAIRTQPVYQEALASANGDAHVAFAIALMENGPGELGKVFSAGVQEGQQGEGMKTAAHMLGSGAPTQQTSEAPLDEGEQILQGARRLAGKNQLGV